MEYLKKIFCSSLLFYMRAWAVHISEEKDLVNNYKEKSMNERSQGALVTSSPSTVNVDVSNI